MGCALAGAAWCVAPVLVAAAVPAKVRSTAAGTGAVGGPKSGSCWSEGFTYDFCCSPDHGLEGNLECWDEVYTYDVCCGNVGGDPSVAGCSGQYFSRFHSLITEYYSSGRARYSLINTWPQVMANFDTRFKLCAPAALQASLLQMEERAVFDGSEIVADRALAYASKLQHALAEGLITATDMQQWPLQRGLERIRDENSRRASRLSKRNRPEVALVISYCAERMQWLNSTLSRSILRFVDLTIVKKCPGVDAAPAVLHRRLWRSVTFLDVEDVPLRADECSAYLGYLALQYHHLPEHMVFVHADAPEHIGSMSKPNILDDTLIALVHGAVLPFAHLGGNRVTMRWDRVTMSTLWRGLFGSSVIPAPQDVSTYCCSHFVVSRERVMLRPYKFYLDAWQFITSTKSYSYMHSGRTFASGNDVRGRLVCQNMMWVWHVIFGENLDLPHRMLDPHLPLFLKTRNIRTAYADIK